MPDQPNAEQKWRVEEIGGTDVWRVTDDHEIAICSGKADASRVRQAMEDQPLFEAMLERGWHVVNRGLMLPPEQRFGVWGMGAGQLSVGSGPTPREAIRDALRRSEGGE